MTVESPAVSSASVSKKKSKKLKTSDSSSSNAAEIADFSTSGLRVIRHEVAKEVLGEAMLVDDDSITGQDLQLLRHAHPAKASQMQMQGGTERVSVTCRNYGTRQQPYKYAVALVSPGAGTVRVWDAQMFTSSRTVACVTEATDDVVRLGANAPLSAASLQVNYRDAQNLLGEAFGTRKRKQAIASAAKNQIKVENMGDASVGFISENLASSASQLMASAGADEGPVVDAATTALLPPYDKETGEVEKIYKLEDLIPRAIYRSIPALHDLEAVKAAGFTRPAWLDRFSSILAKTSGAPREHALRLCFFAALLSAFSELKEAAINGPTGSVAALQKWIPGCPDDLALHVLTNFADPIIPAGGSITARIRHKLPATSRDKAILYCLTVLLHLDNFRVNLTKAAEQLNRPPSKLTTFFKTLGCAIEKPSKGEEASLKIGDRLVTVKYARLTAPLKFPQPPKRKQ